MGMKLLVKKVHSLLLKKRLTISTAESCTGGLLSKQLTETSGSSHYFKMGLIAYSNEAKIRLLRVNKRLLANYGAVSKEVALAMAKAIRKLSKTNLGLAITGLAGPRGATKNKPLGLVYIALADKSKARVGKFNFKGSRKQIRNQAAGAALKLIREWIE